MANRTKYPARTMHHEAVTSIVKVVGAGASAPTVPTTNPQDNFASSTSRTSEGVYVITCKEHFPRILAVDADIVGADGRQVRVTGWSEANKTISVKVWNLTGAAVDDIEVTDTLILKVTARESLA